VESVRVERLEDDSFVATVVIDDHGKHLEFDARSSDAIALALGDDAPIFVAKTVVEQAGHDLDDLTPEHDGPPSQPIAL
jgi:bifunctional DNase/RNase